jgi:hypothetical protein
MIYILGIVACLIFYKLDTFTVVKDNAVEKYKKFRELNNLVAKQYKTVGMILYVSICMIMKMYWMNFIQWTNYSLEVLNKKDISISYVLNGKLYKILIKAKKGPNLVLLVTDENNEDITDTVLPYLGPNNDWHHNTFKPNFWNKKFMCFELSSGEMKSFQEHDAIVLH